MSKREFTLLAHKHDSRKHYGGWFVSEKLDGMRCIYDGGITRGKPKKNVPWANTAKDARYKQEQICTGLWSRYGNVIHAPDWFLDRLPRIPLDGELYTRSHNRQAIFSTIKDIEPTPDWQYVQYWAFDMVPFDFWLMDGQINNTGFKKSLKGCYQWAQDYVCDLDYVPRPMTAFVTTVELMKQKCVPNESFIVHAQERLPGAAAEAMRVIEARASEIVLSGGEGLIIKNPNCYWRGERTHDMVKYKPTDDADGVVVGYVTGRETDKGSKLLGMMGALVLRLENGKEMELSGFTDAERELGVVGKTQACEARAWAADHPGEAVPEWIEAIMFPRGTVVTFKYRGLSDKGVPQEARYMRVRPDA